MSVLPADDSGSRGRIPAHDVKWASARLRKSRLAFSKDGKRRRMLQGCGVPLKYVPQVPRYRKLSLQMRAHHESFDQTNRAPKVYDDEPVEDPCEEFNAAKFEDYSGFTIADFNELCEELVLMPDTIRHGGCKASLQLGLFILCTRWRTPGKFDKTAEIVRRQLTWTKQIYRGTFLALTLYRNCVTSIDIARMQSMLEEWDDEIERLGLSPGAFFFLDGKATKWTSPGNGAAAAAVAAANGAHINLIQRAFYNGHYMFHGAKVQHLLALDGMLHSFAQPLRAHDSAVLAASDIEGQIALLDRAGGKFALAVTDAAYRRTNNIKPRHTETEYAAMADAQTELDERAQDTADAGVRNCVEHSFNDVVTKWMHADHARAHKVFQGGKNNWPTLACTWDLMVFLSNCSCCLRGAARCSLLQVEPPSLREYLANRHNVTPAFPNGHLL